MREYVLSCDLFLNYSGLYKLVTKSLDSISGEDCPSDTTADMKPSLTRKYNKGVMSTSPYFQIILPKPWGKDQIEEYFALSIINKESPIIVMEAMKSQGRPL